MGHGGVKGIDLQSFNPDIVKSPLREEYKIKLVILYIVSWGVS